MTVEQRIRNGMALLDVKVPDWMEKIDLEKLNIGDSEYCVIGPLFGHYLHGRQLHSTSVLGLNLSYYWWGYRHGFDGPYEEMESLTIAWRTAIADRLALAA